MLPTDNFFQILPTNGHSDFTACITTLFAFFCLTDVSVAILLLHYCQQHLQISHPSSTSVRATSIIYLFKVMFIQKYSTHKKQGQQQLQQQQETRAGEGNQIGPAAASSTAHGTTSSKNHDMILSRITAFLSWWIGASIVSLVGLVVAVWTGATAVCKSGERWAITFNV